MKTDKLAGQILTATKSETFTFGNITINLCEFQDDGFRLTHIEFLVDTFKYRKAFLVEEDQTIEVEWEIPDDDDHECS